MYALHFVTRQDVAEDIVQELFVTMWNKQMVFLSYPSFIKQRYAEQWAALHEEDRRATAAFDEEVYRQLYKAIDRLAPKCREIFLMAMDGKRNEEIAETLHIAIETVKTQKKRAIKQQREQTALSVRKNLFLLKG